jgi:hypothetical protein
MPTGVATKFTGAAGKTVALDWFEGSEGGYLSQQRPNLVYECDALLQFKRIRRAERAGGGKIRLDGYHHGLAVLRCALDLKRDIGGPGKAKDHDLIITPRIAARRGHDGKRPLAAFHGSTPLITLRCVAQDMQTRRSKLF